MTEVKLNVELKPRKLDTVLKEMDAAFKKKGGRIHDLYSKVARMANEIDEVLMSRGSG